MPEGNVPLLLKQKLLYFRDFLYVPWISSIHCWRVHECFAVVNLYLQLRLLKWIETRHAFYTGYDCVYLFSIRTWPFIIKSPKQYRNLTFTDAMNKFKWTKKEGVVFNKLVLNLPVNVRCSKTDNAEWSVSPACVRGSWEARCHFLTTELRSRHLSIILGTCLTFIKMYLKITIVFYLVTMKLQLFMIGF